MVVGKPEYKEAIERHLVSVKLPCFLVLHTILIYLFYFQKIGCIHNEVVMEVMWGLKNLLHTLIPKEELDLTNEDRLQRSHGLSTLLDRYGFSHVKPEMASRSVAFLNDMRCFLLCSSLSFSVIFTYSFVICAHRIPGCNCQMIKFCLSFCLQVSELIVEKAAILYV